MVFGNIEVAASQTERLHIDHKSHLLYDKRIQRLLKSEYPMLKGYSNIAHV